MLKAFTVTALLFSTLAYGQVAKENDYKNIKGLTIVDSITWQDIVGGFYISDGFGGYNFRLDSNMTFQKIDFSCMARFIIDSGSWAIKHNNSVVLKSEKHTLYFQVFKFDDFYFFIQAKKKQKFMQDIQEAKVKFKNAKPFIVDDKIYSADYMIGSSLIEKYYAKEIEKITGT